MSTQTGSISFESTGNFSQVVKQNYATLSQIKGQFAVCSTGASTTEKIATTVPTNADWALYAGATVTVKFTSANTASVPTLNVNNTGPKEIRDYNANELLKAAREWPAGAAIAFTYDGTYWRIQDSKLMERVHSAETRVDQTATSITSLASMEDNYTKPDGTTAKNNMKSYVDQTAEGITTTITNISEKIETIANPNLGPFFMWPLTDIYNATTNPNGFWRSTLSDTITKLDDGWAHITLNNASGTSAKYATAHVAKDAVPVTSGTLLVEIANISTDITESTGNALWVDFSKVVDGTQVPQMGSSAAKYFFDNGAYYIAATPTNNENPERWSRSWFGISAGHTAEFDARISFYEGTYDGPYKPYVPISEYIETKSTVNSVKQTADSNSAHISNLTTVLGTNADGTTKSTDIVHKYNELDQTLEGTVSTIGKIQSEIETVANANLSPWFSESIGNIYNGTDNPNGYWRRIATNTSFSVYDMQQKHNGSGGWAHFVGNVTSGNPFVRFEPMPISLKPSTEYTFMLEIDGTFASTLTNVVWKLAESTETDALDLFSVKAELVSPESVTSGVYYIKTTTRADIANATTLSRAYLQLYGTGTFDVYARISLYEGDYSGPYKPYVDPTLSSRLTNAETMIAQNADSIALSATKEELNNINNNIKSIKSTCGRTLNIEDAASLPLLSLDSIYGECTQSGTPTPDIHIPIKSVSPVGGEKNLLPSILNVSQWTKQSEPSGSNMVISNYNTGIHYTWTGVSGYEIVRVTSAFSVVAGQKYRLRCKYNINKVCNRQNAARPFGLSVRKEISGSEDQTSADFIGVAEFQTAVGTNLTTELIFTAPTNKIYLMLNGGMSVDSVDHSVDVWDIELTTGSLEIVSSTGDIAYLDMTDSSTSKPVELYSLNDTYRDVLIIDSSGHALVEKRTYKLYANQLVASDYGTNPKDETLGLELNATGTDPDGIDRFNKVQLGGKTTGYPLPICTFLNGASNASSWTGGSAVLNTIAGTTNSYPHNMYCCVSSSKYANYTAFNTALQNELANEYVIVGLYKDYWYTIDLGYVNLPEVADDTTVHVVAEIQPQICGSWWTKIGEKTGIVHQSSVKENAELHITADGISSEVSKVTSIKYYNSATPSWTLSGIKTYAAEGHSDSWNISSATPLTDLRVGDTVYVKGTDSTRNCPVYIKTTVTSIDSLSRFTGISHGYEDILPVDTIKSTINQSSDTVKIQAKHIEIDGTATFKNSDNTTTTLGNYLNTNYDEKGAAAAVQNNLNNLEIGGTNLVRNGDFSNGTTYWVGDGSTITAETDSAYGHALKVAATSGQFRTYPYTDTSFTHVAGETYSLSFYAKASAATTVYACQGGSTAAANVYGAFSVTTSWKRFEATLTSPGAGSLTFKTTAAATFYLAKVMLVHGVKPMDWSPDPRDITARTQRIYYRKNASGAPSVPTSWVTTGNNGTNYYDQWTTKVPPIKSETNRYLYLYTCEQSQRGDGSLTHTIVLLDDSTTVIDGGNIITGTVTANAIKADSGTFNTANIPNLSAAKITSGDIAADRIKTNVVSAINATANKIDAKNINVSAINIGDLDGEIGGRNLVLDTTDYHNWTEMAQSYGTTSYNGNIMTIEASGNTANHYIGSRWWICKPIAELDSVVLSFDVMSPDWSAVAEPATYTGLGAFGIQFNSTNTAIGSSSITSLAYTMRRLNTAIWKTIPAATNNEWLHFESKPFKFDASFLMSDASKGIGENVTIYPMLRCNGTVNIRNIKLEQGTKATDWTPAPEDVDSAIDDASKIASNYISADSSGIRIASANPSTQKQRIWLTNGRIDFYNADDTSIGAISGDVARFGKLSHTYVNINGNDGDIDIYKNGYLKAKYSSSITLYGGSNASGANPKVELSSSAFNMYDSAGKKRVTINTSGLTIYDASTTPVDIANFGTSVGTTGTTAFARIGLSNSTRFEISPTTLSAYTGNTKYFEVSASGLKYGSGLGNTAATTTQVQAAQNTADTALSGAIEYIVGTHGSTATNVWTGVTRDASISAGKQIAFYMTSAGTSSAATLNLTLSGGGTTGAKNVRLNNSNVTTHYAQYTVLKLTYDGTYWKCDNYNSDSTQRTKYEVNLTAAEAITNGHVICGNSSGYRNIAASVSFDLGYPLLYAGTAIAKGATDGTRNNNWLTYQNITYTNNGTITSGAAAKMLFLKGTLTGNTFKISASPFLTTVVPTSDDGLAYIPLGLMSSATAGYFESTKDVYGYRNGSFHKLDTVSNYMSYDSTNGLKIASSSPSSSTRFVQVKSDQVRIQNDGSNYAYVDTNGLTIYKGDKNVANFGTTARIGKDGASRFLMNADSLQAYNSSNTKYFEISASGILFGGTSGLNGALQVKDTNNNLIADMSKNGIFLSGDITIKSEVGSRSLETKIGKITIASEELMHDLTGWHPSLWSSSQPSILGLSILGFNSSNTNTALDKIWILPHSVNTKNYNTQTSGGYNYAYSTIACSGNLQLTGNFSQNNERLFQKILLRDDYIEISIRDPNQPVGESHQAKIKLTPTQISLYIDNYEYDDMANGLSPNSYIIYKYDSSNNGNGAKLYSYNVEISASEIDSGTFSANRIPGLAASKITSGTLPIARGGTGKTTAADARTALGAEPTQTYSYAAATPVTKYMTGGSIIAYKRGHTVTVRFEGVKHTALTARTTIATLPSGYRPPFQAYGQINGVTNYFIIESDGTVKLDAMSASTRYGMCTYIVND